MFHTLDNLASLLGIDLPSCLGLVISGDLPKPVIIGERYVRWPDEELRRWSAVGCPVSEPLTPAEELRVRKIRLDELREIDLTWIKKFDSRTVDGMSTSDDE